MEENNIKRGVSAVIFDNNGDYYFLILHRSVGWNGWEFPKGSFKEGETEKEAIVRQIAQETGLSKFKVHKKLDRKYEFRSEDGTIGSYDVFLIETSMNIPVSTKYNRSQEHDTYVWTTYCSALDKLTWDDQKEVFKTAFAEIKSL